MRASGVQSGSNFEASHNSEIEKRSTEGYLKMEC